MGESWERLEAWPLFTERVHLAVSKTHRFAGNDAIEPKDLASERLIIRTDCEMIENFTNFLSAQRVQPKVSHKMVSEQDYLVLLEANLGVGLMPESAVRSNLACVPVCGLDLSRTVFVYAVAGRQRSLAVSTLIKLLRAGDWSAKIGRYSVSRGEEAA
ncbi:MAG: LysR family transcriptional regulator substrate-binding protein [Methylocella sp.]